MRKVLALTASTVITLGAWSVASAYGPVSAPASPTQVQTDPTASRWPCPSLHSGFFGGLKGGYAWAKGNLNQNGLATAIDPLAFSQRTDLGIDGGEVGLFLGYDHYFPSNWVLGIEGGAQWTNLSGEVRTISSDPPLFLASNMNVRLKSDWSYDVALRLGHKVYDNSLWYVKAGAQFTHFKFNASALHTETAVNVTNTGAPLANKNQYRAGLLGGVGVEVPITSHCSVGAEYNFTWYQSFSISKVASDGTGDFLTASIRPHESQIVARILWKM